MIKARVTDALVEIADTLRDDFETSAFLHTLTDRSVQLMHIAAAGVLLADDQGVPRDSAASSRDALVLQRLEVRTGIGPGVDCIRTGHRVSVDDLAAENRWPEFTVGAVGAGLRAVHSEAMRHRAQTVGALSFFSTRPGPVDPTSLDTGRALSELAAIGLIQRRGIRSLEIRAEQLQAALDSRILIEQAKGILAERRGLSMTEAFDLLRARARNHNRRLRDVARDVVDATADAHPSR